MRVGNLAGLGCVVQLVLLVLAAFLGGFCLEYVVETWAAQFGNPVDVPYPHVATILVGLVLSELAVPLALITWFLAVIGLV